METYKNELGKKYGDYRVISYTHGRVPSNGCVIWKCQCVYCGDIVYKNGNHLRFSNGIWCPNCHPRVGLKKRK